MNKPNTISSKPALPDIYKNGVGNWLLLFGAMMFGVFLVSAFMLAAMRPKYPTLSVALGAVWVVGVPVYFFFEHIVLFRKYGNPDQYEQFKRVQELASKVWAGAILVLAAFFSGNVFPK